MPLTWVLDGGAYAANWSAADNLTTGRFDQKAVLLLNGRPLVVGGLNHTYISKAELYNPNTDSWSFAGNTLVERFQNSATLLSDGRVLITGGVHQPSSAELYDPDTNLWTAAHPMTIPRERHTATLLPNGHVLVAGGFNSDYDDSWLTSAELYNPVTDTWTAVGSMNTGRGSHTATLLSDGRVLVVGGAFNSDEEDRRTEIYNPQTNTWKYTGDITTPRLQSHSTTLLPNGNVLVAGGRGRETDILSSAELYVPEAGSWAALPSMDIARREHSATLLPNGRVLVAGGYARDPQSGLVDYHSSAELYDPDTNAWSPAPSMISARSNHTATLLPNERVLVVGGFKVPGGDLTSAELYTPDKSVSAFPWSMFLSAIISGGKQKCDGYWYEHLEKCLPIPLPPTIEYNGLMWQRTDDGVQRYVGAGKNYCDSLTLGGYDDWRLPTMHEMKSLVFCGDGKPIPYDWNDACCTEPGVNPYSCEGVGNIPVPTIDPVFSCRYEDAIGYATSTNEVEQYSPESQCFVFFGSGRGDCMITYYASPEIYTRCVRTP